MFCKQCGIEVEDDKKFCPNCGNALENTVADPVPEAIPDAVPDTAVTPDIPPVTAAPESAAAPTPETGSTAENSYAAGSAIPTSAANPYDTTGSMPGSTPNPIPGAVPGGMPYDPTMNPVPPMNQPPKKKKKKVWLIVLLICIPILLIVIVVACLFGYGVSVGKQGAEAVNDYWDAYVNGSGETFAEMVPDDFWTYISDTYDVTEEEAVAGMNLYLQEVSDELGGDLSYDWSQNGVQYGFGSTDTLDDVREVTDTYGLEISSGIGIGINGTVTGTSDSEDHDFAMWIVKIDGEWYNVSVMSDFESVCQSDYIGAAKYEAEYGDLMETYWNAVINADAKTMSTLVPDAWWDLIDEEYGCSQSEAEGYLVETLQELVSSEFGDTTDLSVSVQVTGATEYEDGDLEDLNEGLDTYGVAGEEAVDVDVNVLIGDEESTATYVTMTKINGEWYVYDAMFYYATACYTYGGIE